MAEMGPEAEGYRHLWRTDEFSRYRGMSSPSEMRNPGRGEAGVSSPVDKDGSHVCIIKGGR